MKMQNNNRYTFGVPKQERYNQGGFGRLNPDLDNPQPKLNYVIIDSDEEDDDVNVIMDDMGQEFDVTP